MFKILSLVAVVIQLLPVNGLKVVVKDYNNRFKGIIEENLAAKVLLKTFYEDFGLGLDFQVKLLEQYNYHVSIEKKSANLAYCSGAVVEENGVQIVFTSARCAEGHSADDLVIRSNSAERENGGVFTSVKKIYVPYADSLERDPRLRLVAIYPEGNIPNITALKFPSRQNSYEDDAVVTGWPTMYPADTHKNLLLYTKQRLLSESECGTHRGFLCAGVKSKATSYCYVTTGSPLVGTIKGGSEKVLLGFLMSDKGCRNEITPTPYLDLSLFEGLKQSLFKT